MSRNYSYVPLKEACEVFLHLFDFSQVEHELKMYERLLASPSSPEVDRMLANPPTVRVAHGYDKLHFYFCDVVAGFIPESMEGKFGIYYGDEIGGCFGGKRLDRWQYRDAMLKLGLKEAASAVEIDTKY